MDPESKWSGIWVRIALVGAIVWLVYSLSQIPGYDTSPRGKIDLAAFSVLGGVLIMGLGLCLQWTVDYIQSRKEDADD